MKGLYLKLILFSGLLYYLFGCVSTPNMPVSRKKYTVKQLRALYSSGNPKIWPAANLDADAKDGFEDIGKLPEMPFPADNPYSAEKMELGKKLFFDPRLSQSNQIACASCHDPELAWCDNRTLAFGHDRQNGLRNAMSIINSGFAKKLFWDGRANSLEDQVMKPVEDYREMNEHAELAIGKISKIKGYETFFEKAFGSKEVTAERVSKAIATFERTIKSRDTKFDRFISGESDLFTDDEVMGMQLFRTKAQCINCHNTGYFSNNKFENDGTSLLNTKQQDLGLYNTTKNTDDVGKFRVPSLREVMRTGPWMHNGAFSPIHDVLTFYNAGNPELEKRKSTVFEGKNLISNKSKMLNPLNLSEIEMGQIETFLSTLSSRTARTSVSLPK